MSEYLLIMSRTGKIPVDTVADAQSATTQPRSTPTVRARGGLTNPSRCIKEIVGRLHRSFADDTLGLMSKAGLTMPQVVALHLLAERSPLSVSAIAACLKLSPAATSRLVDRLVDAAFVTRSEDTVDRRLRCVAITAAGCELLVRAAAQTAGCLTGALAGLPGGAQVQLADALARVVTERRALPGCDEMRKAAGRALKKRSKDEIGVENAGRGNARRQHTREVAP